MGRRQLSGAGLAVWRCLSESAGRRVDAGKIVAVTRIRQLLLAIIPRPLQSAFRPLWRKFYGLQRNVREFTPIAIWLLFRCAWYRKKAVIICRCGALGDIICALPICEEVRKRHPGKLLVFVTGERYRNMVLLSNAADLVFGSRKWDWSFSLPPGFTFLGLVEKIYNPKTTVEQTPNNGPICHLIDDLAGSCGFNVATQQPRLFPSSALIKETRAKYGLDEDTVGSRLVIGINGGRSWPIREWDPQKWQKLVKKIHAAWDAVIVQYGVTKNDESDEAYKLTGVKSLVNRLKPEEMVAVAAICDLIISIDSGPIHLAGAVGTPVIGLYGALEPRYFLPPSSPAVGLFGNVPCLFCHHKVPPGHWHTGCPNDINCMKQLDDETVFEAVKSILSQNGKPDLAVQ
jgi:ADP-heptose:LPS heptosyltransferase